MTDKISEYKALRRKGWRASEALRRAKTLAKFEALEQAGYVRLREEFDDDPDFSFIDQDFYTDREREAFWRRVEWHGATGIIGEFLTEDGEWEHADSCWGFVGDDWYESGYDDDIMATTIEAATANSQVI